MDPRYSNEIDEAQGLLLEAEKIERRSTSTRRGLHYLFARPRPKQAHSHYSNLYRRKTSNALQIVWQILRPQWLVPADERKLHPTSWLDGVRGLACLFVVFHHCSRYISDLRSGIVLDPAHLLEFPVISITVAGTAMVDIFFIVSGYCLSYKALQNARARNYSKLFTDLSSMTFRRAIRLFMPCMVASFSFALLSYAGYDVRSPREASLPRQFNAWISAFVQATNPYRVILSTDAFAFGDIFWTICAEFRGSLHVFLVLLTFGRAKDSIRLAGFIFIHIYLALTGRWDILLFHSGILCCELYLIQQDRLRPQTGCALISVTPPPPLRKRSVVQRLLILPLNALAFLFALFLLGRQHDPHDFGPLTFLYTVSDWGSPQSWLDAEPGEQRSGAGRPSIVFGAFLFILQIDLFFPQLKRWAFEKRFPQYLGKVSFSVYLMHSQVLDTIGDACFAGVWTIFQGLFVGNPSEGDEGRWVSVNLMRLLVWAFCMMFVFGPVVCWVGDVATRTLDRGSISFARWVEMKCLRL